MRIGVGVVVAAVVACLPSLAAAKVRIAVDLGTQTMHVESKDKVFDWKVSSGASGYDTPPGSYGVLWMDKDHKSDEYDGAPMPNAIFFKPGFAIHGAYKSAWGHPASHGCVRLPVKNSAILFDLVKAEGAEVTITGEAPQTLEASAPPAPRHRHAAATTEDDGFYGYGDGYATREAPMNPYASQRAPAYDGYYGSVY